MQQLSWPPLLLRRACLVVLVAALLLMPLATLSPSTSPPAAWAWPLHVAALAALAFIACLAFPQNRHRLAAVLFLFSYSALLELAQHFHPQRHGTFEDAAANALGCLLGLLLFHLIARPPKNP